MVFQRKIYQQLMQLSVPHVKDNLSFWGCHQLGIPT